jgi:hypothetical protein
VAQQQIMATHLTSSYELYFYCIFILFGISVQLMLCNGVEKSMGMGIQRACDNGVIM